ncbi:MAG: replicative DNA helicase [Agriterribacter sp.]
MLHRDAYDNVSSLLKPETFYVDAHQRIYRCITGMVNKRMPVDVLTVANELISLEDLENVGGAFYLSKLTKAVVSAANIETHAMVLVQKFISRELIRISGEIMSECYEETVDPFDVLNYSEQKILEIGLQNISGGTITMPKVMQKTMAKIEEWRHLKTTVTGIPTGFEKLDQATRGWQPGDLIIIAARPAVGKTAFMLNLVKNAAEYFRDAKKGDSVGVWSLEMKAYLLGMRMLAAESQHWLLRLQTGRLDDDQMQDLYRGAVARLSGLNIHFDEDMGINIVSLRSKIRRLVKKHKLKIVFIDYLQLLSGDGKSGTREQEIARISRALKLLAVELQIPIVALSQMSRDVEKRKEDSKDPKVSDIRESGAIEQDADVVILLWGPSESEVEMDKSLEGRRYVKIGKQRNGILLKTEFDFKNEIQLFQALESSGAWRPLNQAEQQSINFSEPKSEQSKQDELPF